MVESKELELNEINTNFWNKYPRDEAGFEREVRKGIWFRADVIDILPEPPKGYLWKIDNGGLGLSRKINYRLWSETLGFMPGQE